MCVKERERACMCVREQESERERESEGMTSGCGIADKHLDVLLVRMDHK